MQLPSKIYITCNIFSSLPYQSLLILWFLSLYETMAKAFKLIFAESLSLKLLASMVFVNDNTVLVNGNSSTCHGKQRRHLLKRAGTIVWRAMENAFKESSLLKFLVFRRITYSMGKPGAYPLCPPAAVKDAGFRPPQDYKIRDIAAQVPTSLFLTIIFDEFRKPLNRILDRVLYNKQQQKEESETRLLELHLLSMLRYLQIFE
ncbi:hypothetical protein NC652_015610 [Populus alba x Populus x berolinensis]|nr:hypothetical protein NC652_015610 [Populus alba x Populus x berolinensis]